MILVRGIVQTPEEWRTREQACGRGVRMCCYQGEEREQRVEDKMQRRKHTISTSPGLSNLLLISQELFPSMESWFKG